MDFDSIFCLTRFALELMIFFELLRNFQFSFGTARYYIVKSFSNPLRLLLRFEMLSLVYDQRNKSALLCISGIKVTEFQPKMKDICQLELSELMHKFHNNTLPHSYNSFFKKNHRNSLSFH